LNVELYCDHRRHQRLHLQTLSAHVQMELLTPYRVTVMDLAVPVLHASVSGVSHVRAPNSEQPVQYAVRVVLLTSKIVSNPPVQYLQKVPQIATEQMDAVRCDRY
jgi:hypothetical protein